MLQIIRSNAVESLLEQLAWRVSETPLSSPFSPEVVVAPSPAMARWVNLELARQHGVAANFDYPLPASFVWQVSAALLDDLPESDPLNIDVLVWKIFAILPKLLPEPAFESLGHYLEQEEGGLKRWQLASRIADVFDRYQLYRPELIRDWQDGKGDDDWQAHLWRSLSKGVEGQHRVAVIDRLLESLGELESFTRLPERISLFAVSSLPPLFVEVVHALATLTAVDIYIHAPTDAFWADLISQKELARKRLNKPEEADLWEVGNSLLASWGRQGQALQDLLLTHETPTEEIDAFVDPVTGTLLGRLQQDIFALRASGAHHERRALDEDDSVRVHICHSPMRECQVLHDQLLSMLALEPDLRPEDVLVMVPEISRYAPYVEAVFDQDGLRKRPFIPWNLSDTSEQDEHPLVLVILQLLDLAESRFNHSEILSYLDVPELAGNFGLDAGAVVQIKAWLAQARLRWGLDGEHKKRLGLPATEENTWAQAEQRLFGGYALGECAGFQGIAPIASVEGTRAEILGRFWRLFSKLTETAEQLATPRTAESWQIFISGLLSDFFGEREDQGGRIQRIRDAVSELVEQAAGLEETMSPVLVRAWLQQRLSAEGRYGRYFSGGVTFCGMRPMRSLPFKVICVLGLQDQAFPRRDRLAEFDLMRKHWRPGDPRKSDEDRYLFLETLLCARRRLYLSYVGRDIRKNTERQPSVLLRELLDYIDQQYRVVDDEAGESVSKRLSEVHSLQPFSPRNFAGARHSHDDYWCEVARTMLAPPEREAEVTSSWPDAHLSEAPERMQEVTLPQLERFVRHPVRYFVNSRLHVYFEDDQPEEDEELFAVDGLQRFALKRRLVGDQLRGTTISSRQLRAEGALPHGAFAPLVFDEEQQQVAPLMEKLDPYRGRRAEQLPLELHLHDDDGPRWLTGPIHGIYPDLGLVRWKPSSLKGADILGLWLAHLAWCASGGSGDKQSTLFTTGESFVIRETLSQDAARNVLAEYVGWFWQGVHRPLLLLPKASYAFSLKSKHGGRAGPLTAAEREWKGDSFRDIPGDRDDPYIQLVMRGTNGDPLMNPDFALLAEAFYGQVLSSGEPL